MPHASSPRTDDYRAWHRASPAGAGRRVTIVMDGEPVEAVEGECLAVALAAAGRLMLRRSPERGDPRGMFCLMGICQECVVLVEGAVATSCMEPVRADMVIATRTLPAGEGRWDP